MISHLTSLAYLWPNDLSETERLEFQFEMLKLAFEGKNYLAPLKNPKRILDIGTGTGQWAIEMGDEFPNAEVQGTDLSPIQPSDVPENVHFYVDDASESDWAVPAAHFDYIHTRMMAGSFEDFPAFIKRAFHYMKPGGFIEGQEILPTPCCDDATMPFDWPFLEWNEYLHEAADQANRPITIAKNLKRWYEEAGFVDVQEKVFRVPMNPWAKDKHLKMLGSMMEENWMTGIGGFSMGPFSRALNWSKDEIEVCFE